MTLILIRYGELALKSQKVKRRFIESLINGISDQMERYGITWLIRKEQGRIFLHLEDDLLERAILLLQHIPGITSISPVHEFEITQGLETIAGTTAEFSRSHLHSGMKFAVRARRAGSHPYTSQDAAARAGEAILDSIPGLKVDLRNPDLAIHLEIRGRSGFLFTERFQGMGGLPPDSQGKVLLLLSGDNSAAAGYLLMKRGCSILPVHFTDGVKNVEGIFRKLEGLDPGMELLTIKGKPDPESIEELGMEIRAQAVVTGHRYSTFDPTFSLRKFPVFFPLIGLEENEIHSINSVMDRFSTTVLGWESI